jgi:hypothetical protein
MLRSEIRGGTREQPELLEGQVLCLAVNPLLDDPLVTLRSSLQKRRGA